MIIITFHKYTDATNLEDLFGLMEEMGRERFSINRFEELSMRPGRIGQDWDYSEDFADDFADDFITLAGVIICLFYLRSFTFTMTSEIFS